MPNRSIHPFNPLVDSIIPTLQAEIYPNDIPQEYVSPTAEGLYTSLNGSPQACLTLEMRCDVGLIGNYESLSDDEGIQLLKHATDILTSRGAKMIVGPINGNTWHRYRLAKPFDSSHIPFLGEPINPIHYNDHFIKSGFSIAERYESRIVTDLQCREHSYRRLHERMEKRGIQIQSIAEGDFETHLRAIHAMSLEAFVDNAFYGSISYDEFSGMYLKLQKVIDPDFVLLVYDEDQQLQGFVFSYPDIVDPNRLIFKTLATGKNVRSVGLGVYLYDHIHQLAHQKGYTSVIHATMHDQNNSLKLSKAMNSTLYTEYFLYKIENTID